MSKQRKLKQRLRTGNAPQKTIYARVEPSLHKQLLELSRAGGVSLTNLVIGILESHVAEASISRLAAGEPKS